MKQNRKPGIHLHKTERVRFGSKPGFDIVTKEYYWIIISKNGKTIDRSTNMYSRKRGALNGVIVIADVLTGRKPKLYYDHTGKNGVELVKF